MQCVICGSEDIHFLHAENDIPKWDEKKCNHCYSRFVYGIIIEWDLERFEFLLEPQNH